MQRVCESPSDVKDYLANHRCLVNDKTRKCPFCEDAHRLSLHGTYARRVLLPETKGALTIAIVRLLCVHKGKTVSLLPYFCLPRRQHGAGIVALFLQALILGATLIAALRKVRPDAPGYSTAQTLRNAFLERADDIRTYLTTTDRPLVEPPASIGPELRPIAVPYFSLVEETEDPVAAFMAEGLRFHRFCGKGLA